MNNPSFIPINKGQFTLETPEREALFEKNRGFGNEEAYRENRWQWEENPKKSIIADYPLHVDIELASVCNLRCPMCYTITEEFKSKVNAKLMDYSLFTKLVDECAAGGVYSIRLSLRGESFLHPKIVDAIRYAKSKGIKEVSTLTNGVRLDEKMFTELMNLGMDWITISFDGMHEMYESIRKPAKFDRAVEKIAHYAEIKKAAGKVKPVIKVQAVLPSIQDDPKAFYDVFAPITDMVSSNPLIDYLQNDDTSKIAYIENFSCPQLYQRLVVGADGLVMMCSNDEENLHVLGDANKTTLHEIWHGPLLTKARDSQTRHCGVKDYKACAKCYLPRVTSPTEIKLGDRSVTAENYVNRSQKIGT